MLAATRLLRRLLRLSLQGIRDRKVVLRRVVIICCYIMSLARASLRYVCTRLLSSSIYYDYPEFCLFYSRRRKNEDDFKKMYYFYRCAIFSGLSWTTLRLRNVRQYFARREHPTPSCISPDDLELTPFGAHISPFITNTSLVRNNCANSLPSSAQTEQKNNHDIRVYSCVIDARWTWRNREKRFLDPRT